MQLTYIKEPITFIFQKEKFESKDQLREELNLRGGLFDSVQIGHLIADIDSAIKNQYSDIFEMK